MTDFSEVKPLGANPVAEHEYLPLTQVTSTFVDTKTAAFYMMRRPQTMRSWSCQENGPLRPKRINGRLAWSVAEIKALLGV